MPEPSADPAPPHRRGATVWLTGLPGAGKSRIAAGLAERLPAADASSRVEVLDGDQLRAALSPTLGYSRADREENQTVRSVRTVRSSRRRMLCGPLVSRSWSSAARSSGVSLSAMAPRIRCRTAVA